MPCVYIETPEEIAAQRKKQNAKIIAPWKQKLNDATELLCFVMAARDNACSLDMLDEILDTNPKLQKWWKEHQAADAKRAEKSGHGFC